ncbi:MAG: sodium:alanine symporter family protein [Oscillospiraceae bacterium]|jgi:AGCS family alanine or glycine:cation symporter|nr:sodium:alanine symporter family protein [Oscillospiraceae bacterium]
MLEAIHAALWGAPTLALFLCVGFWFSAKTRFFQITRFPYWMKHTFGTLLKSKENYQSATQNPEQQKGISSFQALTGALAACMGTGNIAGVATAIVLGGPGAVFWMWLSSIFGMMIAFAENTLGVKYRYKEVDGQYMGGGMVILARGVGMKKLGGFWCALLIASSFGVGNMTQGNSAAAALHESFGLSPAAVGIALAALVGVVAAGGIKRLARVSELLIPMLSAVFLLGCIALIVGNAATLSGVLGAVVSGAKSRAAMRWGIARGVFSNEAGLGTSPLIHSSANCRHPAEQGLWGIAEVFVDTTVMCVVTGLAILCSGVYSPSGTRTGAALCGDAFAQMFGAPGRAFISISLCLYAFATLLGWGQYGRQGAKYLLGKRGERPFLVLFVAGVFVGCIVKLETVWLAADVLNALMAFPNLLGLVLLRREAIGALKTLKD